MASDLERVIGVDPIITEARERWTACDEASDRSRKVMLACKKFRAGDQWPEEIKIQRQGGQALQGVAAAPPRPCITVDRISQPVRQISNGIRQANFAINVLPNGAGADQDTADIFKGYLRRMQSQAKGEAPVEWAGEQAVESGIGWIRLYADYVDPNPTTLDESAFDQELLFKRIANNMTVYCDPWATLPTKRDARFMLVTEDLAKEEFKRRYPKADVRGLEDFASTGDTFSAQWVTTDTIRVAEYWRVVFTPRTIVELADKTVVWGDAVPEGAVLSPRPPRKVAVPKIEGYKINAVQVLEQWEWLGRRIPLYPILGEELNVDGRMITRGVIEEAIDAQKMLDFGYSALVEGFALANKAQWLIEEGQVGDYASIWQTANRVNYAYLPYKSTSLMGQPVAPPQFIAHSPDLSGATQLIVQFENAVKATTAIWDPSLGVANAQEQSGKAVLALQNQSELATSNFADNVVRTLTDMGQDILDILPKITRVGQTFHILGIDDTPQQVMVGQPHTVDPKTGAVTALTPEQAAAQPGIAKFYDLTQGRYAVTASVGKSYATKRQEGASMLMDLLPHLPPEMAAALTPKLIETLDIPEGQDLADIATRALPPNLQPPPDGQAPLPPQAQQLIAQLQKQVQDLQPLANKNATDLQKTQIHEQAETQRSSASDQVQIQKTEIAAAATMSAAQAKVDAENFRSYVEALEQRLGKILDLHMAKLTAIHDAATQGRQHATDAAQAALDRAHEVGIAALTHQHTLEQGQQAAALAPAPPPGAPNGETDDGQA